MNDLFSVKDKVIIVTGGSGFLGTQFRESLSGAGAIVENFDVDTGFDTTDEASVQNAVDAVFKKHGRIDGLVTAAAANPKADEKAGDSWAPYSDFSADLFRREVDVNLTGSFLVAKAVSKSMIEKKSGSIVFVSSHYGLVGPTNAIYEPGMFKSIAYGASKAGIFGLARFFAAYLAPSNVRVNVLVPGGMYRKHDEKFATGYSSLTMLGRMAKEGEYNGAVQFLLSDASSYMTGASLVVDGGITAI